MSNPSVKLEGLNQRQMIIADMLWGSDNPMRIIKNLPTEQDRRDAQAIMDMIIHECIESEVGLKPAEKIVKDLLKKIMEK